MSARLQYRALCRQAGTMLLVLAATAGIALAAGAGTTMVAKLGTTEFTTSDFSGFVRALDPTLRKQALADPDTMNRLIGVELTRVAVLNEAKAKGWQQRPDVVRQIERARDDVIVNTYLASVALLPKDFPSTADIQSAYDLNRDRFMAPRQYRLGQIYVAAGKSADKNAQDAARRKAEDIARKTKAPNAKFDDIARASSDHKASAAKGGDLGWAVQEQIVPEIRVQVAGMEIGEISDPIRTPDGWHIMRLIDTKAAAPRPLAEVKDTLIAMLKERKAKEVQQAYVARLLDKNPAAVSEAGLRKLFEAAP